MPVLYKSLTYVLAKADGVAVGEEFVIVCRDVNGEAALAMAEEFRKKVEEYQFPEIYHITCSIGVTEISKEDDFTEAFNRLDKAMYASKHNGRNMVTKL